MSSAFEPPANDERQSYGQNDLRDSESSGLGLTTLSALVVANMIGAGIFTSSGFSLATLGNPGRVLLAWIVCGVWAICGAIGYGGLVKRLPQSGGEYLFLHRFVHPSVGFLAGWISVFAGFTAPIAAAALGAAIYMLPGAEEGTTQIKLLATGLIVVATICHLVGVGLGTVVQNLIVGFKLALIGFTLVWAFGFTDSELWIGQALPERDADWLPGDLSSWSAFIGSMSWVALSYTGFNAAIYVAGESRDATRLVPKAMLLATLLVTAIYWSLNVVYVFAADPEAIAGNPSVAVVATEHIGGESLAFVVRVSIVLSMSSSVFAMLLAGPRVYQKMAEDGVMPKVLQGKVGAPVAAIMVQAVLSIVAVNIADLLQLLKYLGLTLSACGALAVASLCWVRLKLPDSKKLHSIEALSLVVYLGITALILAASWYEHHTEFLAMCGTFVLGLIVYGLWLLMSTGRGKS